MKTKSILTLAAVALSPLSTYAQPSPAMAPTAPTPAVAPSNSEDADDQPEKKIAVTFLGVETSEVPSVLSEQLGLPKGFGLVVDYVVPGSPAAAGDVQPNDIIRMLNDQILMEPDQLAKLIRSYADGTTVTLTVLRKGTEKKVSVKLTKKEMPARSRGRHGFHFGQDFGQLNEQMDGLREQLDSQKGLIRAAVQRAQAEGKRARDEAIRARDEALREVRVRSTDGDGVFHSTKIDLGRAQIVFSDNNGEMKIETVDGKKILTARKPSGEMIFSGPIDSEADRAKMPAELRGRLEKLEVTMPAPPAPPVPPVPPVPPAPPNESDDDGQPAIEQVSCRQLPWPVGASRA